jgi:sugar lactone lactonase YvrE
MGGQAGFDAGRAPQAGPGRGRPPGWDKPPRRGRCLVPQRHGLIDEVTLVVAESHADRLTAWTITDDGTLIDRRVWAALGEGEAPDGICVDAEGAIWYASVPHRHCVRVAEGGRALDTVDADRGCFSCTLGGEDGRTLFVTANRYTAAGASDGVVYTAQVDTPRAGRP